MAKETPIRVYDKTGRYLSNCTRKRAAQMIAREKASWKGLDEVTLLVSQQQERELKRKVRERDGDVCYLCGETIEPHYITVDHIVPRIRGGKEDLSNLSVCHKSCNEEKGNLLPDEYMILLYNRIYLMSKTGLVV